MTITLDDTLARLLREAAAVRGEDPNHYAVAAISDALTRDAAHLEDPDAALSDEEKAAVRAGIERGAADFDAGRFSAADDFYKKMQEKHGIFR
jgi:predicted transcriptional regulator